MQELIIGDEIIINSLPMTSRGKSIWVRDMDYYVGKKFIIEGINIHNKYVYVKNCIYAFPFCSLKKLIFSFKLPDKLFTIEI